MKENRKTALANLTRQINLISPLLTDFENEKQVRTEVVHLDQLFNVKVQETHDAYLKALDDDDEIKLTFEWFRTRNKDLLQLKQRIVGFLNDADKLGGDLRDTHSVKSKSSRRSRRSLSSVSSAKLKLAKAAALEVKASFLKEKQAPRMTTEELELRQQIAQAKAEEKTYERRRKKILTE